MYCKIDNNIPHVFVDCRRVAPFWVLFKAWLSRVQGKQLRLDTRDIIFGIGGALNFITNFCLLHAKWFINCQSREIKEISFGRFLYYLKEVLHVEKLIALNKKNLNKYHEHFSIITTDCLNNFGNPFQVQLPAPPN